MARPDPGSPPTPNATHAPPPPRRVDLTALQVALDAYAVAAESASEIGDSVSIMSLTAATHDLVGTVAEFLEDATDPLSDALATLRNVEKHRRDDPEDDYRELMAAHWELAARVAELLGERYP